MRLVDADALTDSLDDLCDTVCQYSKAQRSVMCGACPLGGAFDVTDNAPTIDAVPVRHGEWTKMSDADGTFYACSECGKELTRVNSFDRQFDVFPRLESVEKTNFCPHCGARMENWNE